MLPGGVSHGCTLLLLRGMRNAYVYVLLLVCPPNLNKQSGGEVAS